MSYFCYFGRKRLLQSTTYYTRQNFIQATRSLSSLLTNNRPNKNNHQSVKSARIRYHDIRLLHNDKTILEKLDPYMRLARVDKPIGTMLLLWPCMWSTALAAPIGQYPDPYLLSLFTIGSFVMRGAGCTINDMWDSKYDAKVSRTQSRPLANKELSHTQALTFLSLQLSTGLGVLLSLPHTQYCFYLGASSLPLVILYPLMKRYTHWPQLVLGLTFNWGCFMGYAASHGYIDTNIILPLYMGSISWTLVYDTLYAHQDKVDDAKLGLKSTALYFASYTKPILYAFSTVSFISWMLAGVNAGYHHYFFYSGMGATYGHLIWQVYTADLDDGDNLAYRFRSNQFVGAMLFGTYVLGNLFT